MNDVPADRRARVIADRHCSRHPIHQRRMIGGELLTGHGVMCDASIKKSRDTAAGPDHEVWRLQLDQQENQSKQEGHAGESQICAGLAQDVSERKFSYFKILRRHGFP